MSKAIVNNGEVVILFHQGLSLEELANKTDIFPEDLGFLSYARRNDFSGVSIDDFKKFNFAVYETA
jgi:hypothetical protein